MDLNGDGLVSMEEFLQVTLQDDSYCQSISAFSNVLIWFLLENYYYHEIIVQFYMCAWYIIQECWEHYDLFLAKPHDF